MAAPPSPAQPGPDSIERYGPPAISAHEIVRLRLLDRLTQTGTSPGGARVTLVRGPAGFGKTTLLAQAYRQIVARGGGAVWLDCTTLDATPAHFLDSLYRAAIRAGIESTDLEFTAADLARRVAHLHPASYLFLDEYERLAGSQVEDVMESLASALPSHAHIIVASRSAPRSWFLRRELRGQATTIDALELRLTAEELRHVLDGRFNPTELAQIQTLTEGWPMAVQLARLRCRDPSSLADLLAVIERGDSGLFEYLTERVVGALSIEQQNFLRDTSLLEFVNPLAANAVLGRDDGYALLTSVIHLQPIVTVTSDRELTVRLHPLIRQFMRDLLARSGRQRESELQRRAAEFFAGRGRVLEAAHHALEAGDPALAVALVDQAGGEQLIFSAGPRKVNSIVACLPPQTRPLSIRLRFIDLLMTTLDGQTARTAALRARLEIDLSGPVTANPPLDPNWPTFARGMAALACDLLADMHDGRGPGAAARAFELDRFCRSHLADRECYLGFVLAFEVLLLARHGEIAHARTCLLEYQTLCERNGFAPNLPSINPQRGMLAFLSGDFDGAVAFLNRSADLQLDRFAEPEALLAELSQALLAVIAYERGEIDDAMAMLSRWNFQMGATLPEVPPLTLRVRVQCLHALGRSQEAAELLNQASVQANRHGATRFLQFLEALRLELDLRQRHDTRCDVTAASVEEWLTRELELPDPSWVMLDQGVRTVICALRGTARNDMALQIGRRTLAVARAQGRAYLESVCLILIAGCQAEAEPDAAVATLRTALELTGRMGALRPYTDLASGAKRLIIAAAAEGGSALIAAHASRILQVLGQDIDAPALWQVLSRRERDILLALAGHETTKATARALGVSPETVKHHLKGIFAKLGVHTREAAFARLANLRK